MAITDLKIQYISHSGFLVETSSCYYLFDYYRGSLPALNPAKPILVFASHSHPDHYNPAVFEKLARQGMKQVTAVLSKDISRKRCSNKKCSDKKCSDKECSDKEYPASIDTITVTFHQKYTLPCNTTLETLQSTDQGVAFLVKCPEGTLYHAGDLNDWVWAGESEQYNRQMTGSYRHEINLLASTPVDAAFLPLDPRQEEYYSRGILYFLKKVKAAAVYPMHYWDQPEIIDKFLESYPEYKGVIRIPAPTPPNPGPSGKSA